MTTIRINEIFLSIQGESTHAGRPCVFVRTTGCPLRCAWCDTKYAYYEGVDMDQGDVVRRVLDYDVPLVEITGGEPLAQASSLELMKRLCDAGKTVLVETSGAQGISAIDGRARVIMDVKCPSSGMADRMRWENIDYLRGTDEVKFVVASREDYEYARQIIAEHRLSERCTVLVSTVFGMAANDEVARWILDDRLPARFQLQLHKYIWDPKRRGV